MVKYIIEGDTITFYDSFNEPLTDKILEDIKKYRTSINKLSYINSIYIFITFCKFSIFNRQVFHL